MAATIDSRSFLVSKDLVIPLSTGSAIVLGRDPTTCNYVLADERVSRVHTMVFFKDKKFLAKDLNSSNGTYLNGKRLSGAPVLNAGDIIEIRPFTFEFVSPDLSQVSEDLIERATDDRKPKGKLEGSLSTLGVTDIIQLLNSTQQNGVLSITDPKQSMANLVFQDGEVVQAAFEDKTGEDAVFSTMRVREGRFEFTKTEPVGQQERPKSLNSGTIDKTHTSTFEKQILRRTQSLLLEGARRIDESVATK
jgi:pSer/pThr/pTyr-binding forkhead associated (FHA) protein